MIRLRSLTIQNFRSFYGTHTVEFPEAGLLLIKGSSPDHGDSSGSGKTSILQAVAFALGICSQPATELKSWGTDKMQVDLTLWDDDEIAPAEIIIRRGKFNAVEYVGGNSVTGAKAIDAEIRQLFGISPEVLQAITYREQNARGSFLSMTDAEKKEFLTGLLGLGKIEAAISESEVQAIAIGVDIARTGAILAQLQSAPAMQPVLPEPADLTPIENAKDDILGKLDDATNELARTSWLGSMEDPEIERLKKLHALFLGKMNELQDRDNANSRILQARKAEANLSLRRIDALKMELSEATLKLDGLKNGKCPTCGNAWENHKYTIHWQERSEKLKADLAAYDVNGLNAILAEPFPEPHPALPELQEQFTDVQAALTAAIAADAARRAKDPRAAIQERILSLNRELAHVNHRLAEGEQYNARNAQMRKQRDEEQTKRTAAEVATALNMAEHKAKLAAELDFQESLGRKGFLGVIFGDILHEIRTEANARLAQLANVSQVTLDLVTETQTQAGTAKKSITPIFYVNGNETRFSSLSGGMQTSVDLVVDLALMTVVQRRTGTMPGFLFLDEAFNGQGVVTKEASLEALRAYAQEKLIVVIDHSSETKEFFSQVIEVENAGGRSKIASLG